MTCDGLVSRPGELEKLNATETRLSSASYEAAWLQGFTLSLFSTLLLYLIWGDFFASYNKSVLCNCFFLTHIGWSWPKSCLSWIVNPYNDQWTNITCFVAVMLAYGKSKLGLESVCSYFNSSWNNHIVKYPGKGVWHLSLKSLSGTDCFLVKLQWLIKYSMYVKYVYAKWNHLRSQKKIWKSLKMMIL